MRILLPPSEAKTAGGLDPWLTTTTDPTAAGRTAATPGADALVAARHRVRLALAEALAQSDAADVLGLPARSAAADLAADAAAVAGTAPLRPALERYAGIVYEGLAAATLTPAARRRADSSVLIFSGLLGVVRGDEPVPSYRVPAATRLPGVGILTTFWRPVLSVVLLDLLDGLVIDLRSTDYAAMWRASRPNAVPVGARRAGARPMTAEGGGTSVEIVTVRVLSERPGGEPGVISHPSKLGKGRLARALLSSRREPRGPADIVAAWERAGGRDGVVRGDTVDLLI